MFFMVVKTCRKSWAARKYAVPVPHMYECLHECTANHFPSWAEPSRQVLLWQSLLRVEWWSIFGPQSQLSTMWNSLTMVTCVFHQGQITVHMHAAAFLPIICLLTFLKGGQPQIESNQIVLVTYTCLADGIAGVAKCLCFYFRPYSNI